MRLLGGVVLACVAMTSHALAQPKARTTTCADNPLASGCDGGAAKPRSACATNPLARGCEVVASADDSGELFQTVKTTTSRAKLSESLVAPAKKAQKARDWSKAIPLYQALVVARGPSSAEAKQLATLWTLAGQNERAADAWTAFAKATKDPQEREAATTEALRLGSVEDPFADKLALASMAVEAKKAFAAGRAAFAAKRYGDALVSFHMGLVLAPDLPGFLRELGSTYDKLGAHAHKREFYLRYLVQRPLGGNADVVRAELAKNPDDKKQLGTLMITSSLPCLELWVNRQRVTNKLPGKGIVVAPGSYKGLCFNPKYEMALFEYATVEAGKPALMSFSWAIIQNKLEKPFGRIALENPKSPGLMIDLGITSSEIGVAAPPDGRKLKMILKDDSGARVEERSVKIEPGQKIVVTW